MIIYGLVFTLRYFGWPSVAERKNKIMRAIRTGFSSTALMIGLILMYFYWSSPATFWSQWTLSTFIGAVFFFVAPIFVLMTVTSFIQFSVLEKTQLMMTDRLRKIIGNSTRDENDPK
jgi:hypothetical protein